MPLQHPTMIASHPQLHFTVTVPFSYVFLGAQSDRLADFSSETKLRLPHPPSWRAQQVDTLFGQACLQDVSVHKYCGAQKSLAVYWTSLCENTFSTLKWL
jgi:hypothetical protein